MKKKSHPLEIRNLGVCLLPLIFVINVR